ncbi:MAG: hypothetical protein PHW31_04125 [Candidatus Pacebacteria bacterium]|nr:hypothetical protein [Candidatus Paceibacterota bacterium]
MVSSVKRKSRQFLSLKPLIIGLRKEGKTYSEIQKLYPIPKGTLSDWLKNVKIPKKSKGEMDKRSYEKWKVANEIFIKKRMEDALKVRVNFENGARKEIKKISPYALKLIGATLYWAEGGKTKRNFLRFVNSDPIMVKLVMKFFREICKISNEKMKARIHIYPGMNYEKILNFWAKLTQLPKGNFYIPQTQISKSSQGKRPRNTFPYGTIHLSLFNTPTVAKVMGWIKGISEQI